MFSLKPNNRHPIINVVGGKTFSILNFMNDKIISLELSEQPQTSQWWWRWTEVGLSEMFISCLD